MEKLLKSTGENYLEAVARLASHLPKRPQVLTHDGPGQLVGIDLDQDLGYPIAVRRKVAGSVFSKVFYYSPSWVVLLPEQPAAVAPPQQPSARPFDVLQLDHNPVG